MSHDDEREPENGLPEEEDFASLLEASLEPRTFAEGDTVEGTIVSVGSDVAFVDVGGKGEATIELEELADEDGAVDVAPGDTVLAVVVSTLGGLRLSHKLARGAATRQRLHDAFQAGLPVEGKVAAAIKGGYEVRIGGQRAFCPISQIDTAFTEDPSIHEGQLYTFRIVELKRDGKDVVVSRRALLEEEERERADEIRASLVPDAVVPGRVANVREFGAFVDLGGGVQGLIHVSQMGWSRVDDPESIVKPGDEVEVKVLRVGDDGKIALSLKALQRDPWSSATDTYEVGQVLMGTVSRVADIGAFVELEPGIEALAHATTFPASGDRNAWKATVKPGKPVAVEILSFEPERKRIGVTLIDAEERHQAREYRERQRESDGGERGIGSLADQLRNALGTRDDDR